MPLLQCLFGSGCNLDEKLLRRGVLNREDNSLGQGKNKYIHLGLLFKLSRQVASASDWLPPARLCDSWHLFVK